MGALVMVGRLADPILTRDGRELRLFFNGRNVDNRNRVDPVGAAGFPTSPLIEAACVATHAARVHRQRSG